MATSKNKVQKSVSCDDVFKNATPIEMAQYLHTWAVEEMGLHTNPGMKMATVEQLSWITRGSMQDIWKFVLNNVKSRQTVQKVQGNLMLHGKKEHCRQREQFLEKKKQLLSKLNVDRRDVEVLEGEVSRLETDVIKTESDYQQSCRTISECRHRSALLTAYSCRCKVAGEKTENYSQEVSGITNSYKEYKRNSHCSTLYFSKQKRSPDDNSAALETACGKNVRESCKAIASFRHQLLKGQFTESHILRQKRNFLWSKVEDSMREYTAANVMSSLADNALESVYTLKEEASKINVQRDIEQLKFKYERGNIKDISQQQHSMLHAVHELLEEAQKEHISRFLLREKNSKQNVIVKCNLTEIQKQIDDELMMVYRGQPGCLLLAKELFSTELDLASQTAVVDHLESVCAELETTAKENEEANRMLLQKYLKIQNFTVVVETNQNIIQLLLRQNNDSKRKLEEEQHQLHQYIQNNLCSQEVGTVALATQLKDGVKSEVDKFCSLSLPYLMLTTMDDTELIAVRNLSINRLHNTSLDSGGQTIQHVLNTLKFPLYKAPECLLPHVIEMKVDIANMTSFIVSQEQLKKAITGMSSNNMIEDIATLTEKIKIHDREHKRRVLPILKQRLSETTPAKERLSKIKKLESVWWDQPAQNLVTWMRVDDMTMDEVKNTWRVETTKLIQS